MVLTKRGANAQFPFSVIHSAQTEIHRLGENTRKVSPSSLSRGKIDVPIKAECRRFESAEPVPVMTVKSGTVQKIKIGSTFCAIVPCAESAFASSERNRVGKAKAAAVFLWQVITPKEPSLSPISTVVAKYPWSSG